MTNHRGSQVRVGIWRYHSDGNPTPTHVQTQQQTNITIQKQVQRHKESGSCQEGKGVGMVEIGKGNQEDIK